MTTTRHIVELNKKVDEHEATIKTLLDHMEKMQDELDKLKSSIPRPTPPAKSTTGKR